MKRRVTVSVLTALAYVVALCVAPGADAATKLDNNLKDLWTTVFETPSAQNSFGTGGPAYGCWNLGGTVAPFGPSGIASCTVKTGTQIFVAANSVECSTFEGDTPKPPTPPPWTEAQLRKCADDNDLPAAPGVTVDDKPVPVTEAETPLLDITLPADNILALPAGTTGQSVAHGWVTLLHPLTPGTHTIILGVTPPITTTIIVQAGR